MIFLNGHGVGAPPFAMFSPPFPATPAGHPPPAGNMPQSLREGNVASHPILPWHQGKTGGSRETPKTRTIPVMSGYLSRRRCKSRAGPHNTPHAEQQPTHPGPGIATSMRHKQTRRDGLFRQPCSWSGPQKKSPRRSGGRLRPWAGGPTPGRGRCDGCAGGGAGRCRR